MHYYRREAFVQTVACITCAALLLFSCSKKSTEPEDEPPVIPPLSTFLIDFDEFPSGPHMQLLKAELGNLSYENWAWAAGNLLVWNTLLTVGLAVPVAAFGAAIGQVPVRQPDGSWVWTYSFTANFITHTAELHGKIIPEGTKWDMYISKEGEYTDFLWYSGLSNFEVTEGTWTLNKNPGEPVEFIGIDWQRNLQDSTADIKYENIEANSPENGGYIFYGTSTDTLYNAFYEIFNKGKNNITQIQWDRLTHQGRVADSSHFHDSAWHCWDTMLNDITCPSLITSGKK